jgi:hypothetical protein
MYGCVLPLGVADVGFLWVAGFHGSIAALLALIGVYWLNLTFFSALSYMILPTVAAVFFGHRVLSAIHAHSTAAKEKSD